MFPCVGLIAITAVVPQFYNTEVRTTFLMTLTACLVAVFIFIRNYERVDDINPHSLTLMHRRYLEYLRSLIWIVAFILVGYFGWEITAFRDRFVCLVKLDMQEHLIAGLTQLGTTVGGGVGVVFYSITQKLNQVEKKL